MSDVEKKPDPSTKASRKATGARKNRPRKRKQPMNLHQREKTILAATEKKQRRSNIEPGVNCAIGYVILNFLPVFSFISEHVKCKECGGAITFKKASGCGLGFKLQISCSSCDPKTVSSSPYISSAYEINTRLFFAMRLLGIGLSGVRMFCGLMDLPKPLAQPTFNIIMQHILRATTTVRDSIFEKSAKEEKEKTEEEEKQTDGITVSGDSTWHKRGFNSLFGVTSIIGNYTGKILDIFVSSKFCEACEDWRGKEATEAYKEFMEEHVSMCQINHTSSAEKIEANGMCVMFQRSESKHGVKYINYVSDEDSEIYPTLLRCHPYSGYTINKKNCVERFTQNVHESLNKVICRITPESTYSDSNVIEIAANVAASKFNEGNNAYLRIMENLGIEIGEKAFDFCKDEDSPEKIKTWS